MNFRDEIKTMDALKTHYNEVLDCFKENRVVGVFLAGSQNYGLEYEYSDVDSKAMLLPSLDDIIFNNQPISTTHIRANNEHIDFKDARLMIQCFYKQNINYLEILFTDFFIVNPKYIEYIDFLRKNAELVAHYDPKKAVCTMGGVARTKYSDMTKDTPAKHQVYQEKGYDPKELSHLIRIEDFLQRYIEGESFRECLYPKNRDYILSVKRGIFSLGDATRVAEKTYANIQRIVDEYVANYQEDAVALSQRSAGSLILDTTQRNLMENYLREELKD